MALKELALRYHAYSKEELRTFVMQRLNLFGREYKKSSKPDLVKRLHRLDEIATFRFMDLPPELREHIYGCIFMQAKSPTKMLLVSRQTHDEAKVLYYQKIKFNIWLWARNMETSSPSAQWSITATYHEQRRRLDDWSTSVLDVFHWKPDMFCNIRRLEICLSLCHGDEMPLAQSNNATGNHNLFCISALYALHTDSCRLQTIKVYPEFHEPDCTDRVGLTEVLKIIWPLKLLESSLDIDIFDFPKKVVRAFSQEAAGADETMLETTKSFARTFLVEYQYPHLDAMTRTMCINCLFRLPSFRKASMLFSMMKDYVGPDSTPELKAWIELAEALEHPVCTHQL